MDRREFLAAAGAAGTLAAATAAAAAQDGPEIRWRLTSSYPKSLDTIYGAADTIAARVAALTGGRFQIRVFAGGEIVPGLQALDAVQSGTVELCHTASYYYVGKDPTFAFDTALPFGLNARQQTAWTHHGGGRDLFRAFSADYNVLPIPAGNTGAQMGGWFRREIRTVADLRDLKFRIGGLAGQALSKLGVVPQQIAGGDVYAALEKGTIDAVEWSGPYDDEKLGFNKVAPFYYYPGWWEGSAQLTVFVNLQAWERLPPLYRAVLESACASAHTEMQAKYDAFNPAALRRLVAAGVQLRPFPREVMAACYKAATALHEEVAARNPRFAALYEPWKRFRDDQYLWFRVAENGFENFAFTAAQAVR